MYWFVMSTLFMGLAGIGVYLFYLKRGQFDDPEEVKYQIFREENED